MPKPSHEEIEHRDCKQMALVLDGVAGTVHQGLPVDAEELKLAAVMATTLWESGPKMQEPVSAEFKGARSRYVHAVQACARGEARDASILEASARVMADDLRHLALETEQRPVRHELPRAFAKAISKLAGRYARNAVRPAPAAA